MNKLINQIIKFGVVGVIAFIIDFIITMVVYKILSNYISIDSASMIGSFFGFTISVIVNYLLSMKYVFVRRDNLDKRKEFLIFVVLSIIGLLINEIVIWGSVSLLYKNSNWLQNSIGDSLFVAIAKILATAIVMVYNFVTRKIFLEK